MIYYEFKLPVTVLILWIVLVKESLLNNLSIKNYTQYNIIFSKNTTSRITTSYNKINTTISYNKHIIGYLSNDGITQYANDDVLNATKNVYFIKSALKIEPALPEYILLSNSTSKDHTFTCSGNEKVKWYFEQYDGNLLTKKSKSAYNEVLERYVTMFSLSRGAYFDTGYYYCVPRSAGTESIKQFKKIYIFVQHETYLFAIPNYLYQYICQDSGNDKIVLPCRTTSPDIHIKLIFEDNDITESFHYDAKLGFMIDTNRSCTNVITKYFCVAQKNNIHERRMIGLFNRTLEPVLEPALSEYILLSNSTLKNHTFTCKGRNSVQWYYEKYDGSLYPKKSKIIFDSVLKKYVVTFSLSKGAYLDTGYHYCALWGAGKEIIKKFKKIYIYIQHDFHLFAIPDDYNIIWHDSDKDEVILPCRPTSPDVNVKVFLNGSDLTNTFRYDERIGFTLDEYGPYNYTCVAQRNNIREERIIRIHIRNVEISPALSEYTLTSNSTEDDRVFICKGNEPVEWYFEQYDGNFLRKKNQSIKIFSQNLNNYTYSTSFSLIRTTYLDTGYYYCAPTSVETQLIKKFKKIYIFIKHETYLFAIPDDYTNKWLSIENYDQLITIPCRPTSPDINVKLYLEGNDVSREWFYDEKLGFISFLYHSNIYDDYICVAQKYKISEKRQFIANIESNFRINYKYLDHVISGQNVSINCSSAPLTLYAWTILKWIVPDKMKNQPDRIKIERERTFRLVPGSITLSIKNVTTKDEGNYVCKVLVDLYAPNPFNITYKLNVISPNGSYLNLKILDDASIKIRPVGYHSVHWNVQVSTYPNASLEWRDPEGNKIKTILEKIYIKNDNHSSQLVISNLELFDSGVYKLIAYNRAEQKEINVTLLVEDGPTIVSINSSESKNLHCELGRLCIFEFHVRGYPLPDVEWTFQNCTNYTPTECEELNTEFIVNKIPLSPVTVKFTIIMIDIKTGTLICNALNKFGKSIQKFTILIAEDTWMGEIFFFSMLTILLIVIVIVIVGVIIWFTKRISKKKLAAYYRNEFEKGTVQSWNPHLGVEEQAHLLPYDNRWEFPIDKIKLGEQIGSGAFGIVYKAEAIGIFDDNTTTTVAVKTVRPSTDPCHKMALASELKIMAHLGRHINIVNLLGACTVDISKKLLVIVEYCCFGSIDRYMLKHKDGFINQVTSYGFIEYDVETVSKNHNYENFPFKTNNSETRDVTVTHIASDSCLVRNKVGLEEHISHHNGHKNVESKPLCTYDLLCWSYQVSKGMDYLASRKILHGDLATRNILLTEENVVKICDFGLAKNMYKSEIYKKSKKTLLPIKWLAIESIGEGIFSTASDVWSFGIVLWEMFSLAAVPYPNIQLDDLLNRLVQGYRMEQPIYSNSKIYDIMLDCWKTKPIERPSFSDLVERVGNLLQECTKSDYIEPNDQHMKIYSERLPSSDILSRLAAPTRSNNSLIVPEHLTESSRKSSERSDSIDDVEMKTMVVHNASYFA